jgi:hypothetical protein
VAAREADIVHAGKPDAVIEVFEEHVTGINAGEKILAIVE